MLMKKMKLICNDKCSLLAIEVPMDIGCLCHIGLGVLKFSLLLYNSDRNIRDKVV